MTLLFLRLAWHESHTNVTISAVDRSSNGAACCARASCQCAHVQALRGEATLTNRSPRNAALANARQMATCCDERARNPLDTAHAEA